MTVFKDIVEFVDKVKSPKAMGSASQPQIAQYLYNASYENRLWVVNDEQGRIQGVVVFDPFWIQGFFVEQIWTTKDKSVIKSFINEFKTRFPSITEVFGYRLNRLVKFNLKTLEKIYGR